MDNRERFIDPKHLQLDYGREHAPDAHDPLSTWLHSLFFGVALSSAASAKEEWCKLDFDFEKARTSPIAALMELSRGISQGPRILSAKQVFFLNDVTDELQISLSQLQYGDYHAIMDKPEWPLAEYMHGQRQTSIADVESSTSSTSDICDAIHDSEHSTAQARAPLLYPDMPQRHQVPKSTYETICVASKIYLDSVIFGNPIAPNESLRLRTLLERHRNSHAHFYAARGCGNIDAELADWIGLHHMLLWSAFVGCCTDISDATRRINYRILLRIIRKLGIKDGWRFLEVLRQGPWVEQICGYAAKHMWIQVLERQIAASMDG